MAILSIMVVNNNGHARLLKFYKEVVERTCAHQMPRRGSSDHTRNGSRAGNGSLGWLVGS